MDAIGIYINLIMYILADILPISINLNYVFSMIYITGGDDH